MNTTNTPLKICFVVYLFAAAVWAQAVEPPGVLNHQGRITVDGENFDGTGYFKFSLVRNSGISGETVLWHQDGTSTSLGMPSGEVDVAVVAGHYVVLLGDVSNGMVPIPTGVFAGNSNVSLRIWFSSTSGSGFQQLAPDRRIVSVGYALSSEAVMGSDYELVGGNLSLPITDNSTGIVFSGGETYIHAYGDNCFFSGLLAGNLTHTGFGLTGIGKGALMNITSGSRNSGFGRWALRDTTTGERNTGTGQEALRGNTSGSRNTATGRAALFSNNGDANTASGNEALFSNSSGNNNTAVGESAMLDNTTGSDNTAVGNFALENNTGGARNIVIGSGAGSNLTSGDDNIVLGNDGVAAESSTIRIGDSDQNRTFIGGIRGVTTGSADGIMVVIDSNGQLGTVSSSRRYKEDIREMGSSSDRIKDLRPVTFRYKEEYSNGEKPVQYGLIAEEVAEVFPDLAVYNEDGQPETVKYHLLTPILLNEVQKLQSRGDRLEVENAALRKRLDEMEKKIGNLMEISSQK